MKSYHSSKNASVSYMDSRALLVGNAFPLSLVRRRVDICPAGVGELLAAVTGRRQVSFWGHANTLAAASRFVGFDLTPAEARPALSLDADGYPCYGGDVFRECWVVSPDYVEDFRPVVGQEVPADRIAGWQVLHLLW